MRFVAIKEEERQAGAVVFRARDLLVRQRTQLINALRGHLLEYGWVVPQGSCHVAMLFSRIEDPACLLPDAARLVFKQLIASLKMLDEQIATLDREVAQRAKQDEEARRLMTIPGFGPITATAITALAPSAESFG